MNPCARKGTRAYEPCYVCMCGDTALMVTPQTSESKQQQQHARAVRPVVQRTLSKCRSGWCYFPIDGAQELEGQDWIPAGTCDHRHCVVNEAVRELPPPKQHWHPRSLYSSMKKYDVHIFRERSCQAMASLDNCAVLFVGKALLLLCT